MSLQWNEQKYGLSINHVDEQHKTLIKATQQLEQMLSNPNSKKDDFAKFLEFAVAYAKMHFATEEDLFRIYGYDDAENHEQEHLDFTLEVISSYKSYLADKKLVFPERIMVYLDNWLNNHIAITDKAFGGWCKHHNLLDEINKRFENYDNSKLIESLQQKED